MALSRYLIYNKISLSILSRGLTVACISPSSYRASLYYPMLLTLEDELTKLKTLSNGGDKEVVDIPCFLPASTLDRGTHSLYCVDRLCHPLVFRLSTQVPQLANLSLLTQGGSTGKGMRDLSGQINGRKKQRQGTSRSILALQLNSMSRPVIIVCQMNLPRFFFFSRELYPLMISGIVPRPIAFVSSLSVSGIPNLAPFR